MYRYIHVCMHIYLHIYRLNPRWRGGSIAPDPETLSSAYAYLYICISFNVWMCRYMDRYMHMCISDRDPELTSLSSACAYLYFIQFLDV